MQISQDENKFIGWIGEIISQKLAKGLISKCTQIYSGFIWAVSFYGGRLKETS